MAGETKITVILPHLNQPDYLKRTLIELNAQNYPRECTEIIVVDNGSTQEALNTVDTLASEFGFRLLHEAEPGPGPARNTGVANATHEILAFIDSDCVPDPNWLRSIAKNVSEVPDMAIGGDVRILYVDPARLTEIEAYESVFAYQQKNYIEKKNFSGTGNLAMQRSTYDKVGPFRGLGVAEDRDWGQRAAGIGVGIKFCPDMIVFHPGRISFEELCVKWRRHILHDYEQSRENHKSQLSRILMVGVVLASIPVHAVKVLFSDRLKRTSDRFKAIKCLSRIRSYRARYMVKVLSAKDERREGPKWNR